MDNLKIWVALALSSSMLVGCGGEAATKTEGNDASDPAQAHAHAEQLSYAAAVARLKQDRDQIQTAFSAGKPEDCHEALHDVGHLLTDLPAIAQQAGLAASDLEEVKVAAASLMEAFGKVDKQMHGAADGADYGDVAADVDVAMATLEAKSP